MGAKSPLIYCDKVLDSYGPMDLKMAVSYEGGFLEKCGRLQCRYGS